MGWERGGGNGYTVRAEKWGGGEEEPGVGNFILLQKV